MMIPGPLFDFDSLPAPPARCPVCKDVLKMATAILPLLGAVSVGFWCERCRRFEAGRPEKAKKT